MNFLWKNMCINSARIYAYNANFHTTTILDAYASKKEPRSWLPYNEIIYTPQNIDEEPRPAFVCHQKLNFKYSPKKLWYLACFVRGMTVDEAIKQLSFLNKKGAIIVKEAILEAQNLAVTQHNVEFKSNLWIAESNAAKGIVIKGGRRHARARIGEVRYTYCHYFVRLEEGKPPEDFYKHNQPTPAQQLDKWLESMRHRNITNSY